MSQAQRIMDAAAVMLVREGGTSRELFWVQRSREVSLGGGFFAFPGGRIDAEDAAVAARFGGNDLEGRLRATAIRELFEETGVLMASGPVSLPQAAAMRKALLASERSFVQVLDETGWVLDFDALQPAGRWCTPPFLPVGFDTRFFLAFVPSGQAPEVWKGELARGEWITPKEALTRWGKGRALLHPPAQHLIESLQDAPVAEALPRMRRGPHLINHVAQRIEFQRGILLAPVRTPTLPPATHTNCYIVGESELVVIDPASPYEDEQSRLAELCEGLRRDGRKFREILLTHHHHDHVGGVNTLRAQLGVPVRAHQRTAELLEGEVKVDATVADDEIVPLPGSLGLRLRAVFTPGHAPGHLCWFEEQSGALITGDMVAGIGTIVVNPPEGDMAEYVGSLERLRSLPVNAIYPAHGPAIPDGPAKLDEYIAHRAARQAQVTEALERAGKATPEELVPFVYQDVDPSMYGLAARSLTAVLEKMVKERSAIARPDGRFERI
jgi:glyoxylase-like metal-dependent hydrolase (beta-lactamase superfamily II)/8-oxo-dGTP pyrophosphatase MutT (NUDIX family)